LVGTVEDEVSIMTEDYKHLIQRIRLSDGRYGYRTGYYTYDVAGRTIKWGQFTQFLTAQQYQTLLSQAFAKGWDIRPNGGA
jgi:hypothetical protein